MSPRTKRPRHGGSFAAFLIGLAVGAALGAVLMHKALSERQTRGVEPAPLQPQPPPAAATPPAAGSAREDWIERKMREWNLDPDQIKRELDRAGEVIRREGSALGSKLNEATMDARIITVIKAKYTLDQELSAWDIAVGSQDGHVTLSGTVNSPALIGRAVVIALETDGVADVVSSLRVKTGEKPPHPAVDV